MPNLVLVVDDSTLARKLLIRALPKDWAGEVVQAADGAGAMAAMRSRTPDVLFLDLNMPDMDGYEVLSAMQHEPHPAAVIVLSGDIQPKARERVMALGASAFVKKPLDQQALTEALRRCGVL